MTSPRQVSGPEGAPSTTSVDAEVARLAQAMEDLNACEGASVSLVHCSSATRERTLGRSLAAAARKRGFVTAQVSLREHGLESPDWLVVEILDGLVPPSESQPRGLLWLLDEHWERHRKNSDAVFAKAAAKHDAGGDLTALCRAYLASEQDDPRAEIRAYTAWCEGVEPPRKYRNRAVRHALSERTAQRALSELTRIICALGHRGLVLILSEGDSLASRTERQREKAYTVLRELVDNFDGSGGAIATRIVITGQDPLFEGDRSVRSVDPLRMRLEIPSAAEPAPPHRSWTTLGGASESRRYRRPAPPERRMAALRNLIRISEGLPPTEGVTKMSVGAERLDRTIRRLFELVSRTGSFFSLLVGEYGSGKTHLMMHLAERALEEQRPVFWLNLERTNIDLGNPARHLSRFLEHSELPLPRKPNALALASRWTRSPARLEELCASLAEIAGQEGEAAIAAAKGMRIVEHASDPGFALESYLSGHDLEERAGDPAYRRDAYRRIFLWFDLLARLEQIRGPVILIDEAENLYTSGRPPASRRTSLRSLSFYCGGSLPGTCVVMAMTPPAFEEMKAEARDLLEEADQQKTTLDLENVARFRRALWGLKPDPVRPMSRPELTELCERVRKMHRSVRGAVDHPEWDAYVRRTVKAHSSPRALIRALTDELESMWWATRSR